MASRVCGFGSHGMKVMPKAFPKEFRRDVIAVARNREGSLVQVAKNYWCLDYVFAGECGRPRAFHNAVAMRGAYGTIVHSDRDCQFRSHHYVTTLNKHDLSGSMG